MTLETIRAVFAWCTVINVGLLIWWLMFFILARNDNSCRQVGNSHRGIRCINTLPSMAR